MSAKLRNWLLGGLGLAIFIVGIPLAQRVVANTNASAASGEKAVEHAAASADPEKAGHPSVIQVGDQYLQIVPGKDGSVNALLYDSSYKLLTGNENEVELTFALPSGEKKTVKITTPETTCPMGAHSSGKDDCCATAPTDPHPDTCPQMDKTDKAAHK